MLSQLFKKTENQKSWRLGLRKFVRRRYESVSNSRQDIKLKIAHFFIKKFYKNFSARTRPFEAIQLQTQVGCNDNCSFCPANKPGMNLYGGAKTGTKMDPALFNDIVKQLEEMDYKGRISPYLMNEPLMDERLIDEVALIREKCSRAFIFIQTNGLLLDKKLTQELVKSGVDELLVNDYTPQHDICKKVKEMDLDKVCLSHVTLEERSDQEVLSNRAGNVPHSAVLKEPLRMLCVKPFRQMFIGFDGKALLCCQDWKFEEVMGDLNQESLEQIWDNQAYRQVRFDLDKGQRLKNHLCAKCDFSGLW